jgi:CRISPR/Cas system CMR subunit Cmr4 (Cas7 group RAMP superfamily)
MAVVVVVTSQIQMQRKDKEFQEVLEVVVAEQVELQNQVVLLLKVQVVVEQDMDIQEVATLVTDSHRVVLLLVVAVVQVEQVPMV